MSDIHSQVTSAAKRNFYNMLSPPDRQTIAFNAGITPSSEEVYEEEERDILRSWSYLTTAGIVESLSDAADCGAKAALASRTNTLFSIPMLLFMGAATHYKVTLPVDTNHSGIFWVLAIIIGLLEINAVIGKPGPMVSVKGVITSGLVLTVVLFAVIHVFLSNGW